MGRRLLLEALLRDEQPEEGWRKKDLETRTGVTNGGLDVLLAGAVDLGLATLTDGRVQRAPMLPDLAEPLCSLLDHALGLPDRPPRPLPRRPYRRSR